MNNVPSPPKTLGEPIPRHIAIVMDGNGRWAKLRGLPRQEGHVRGAAIVRDVLDAAKDFGVERLTLYCFSNENWKRPKEELDALWTLLKRYMIEERPTFMENNIRLKVLGRRDRIPEDTVQEMDETLRLTAKNTGLTLALAINYGARQEIVDAIRSVARDLTDPEKRAAALAAAGTETVEELIDEKLVASRLYDGEAPDPDLFIRTGGELRLSNYLLWQLSYAELWFTDLLWPDFTAETLKEAIVAFQRRRRRYGGLDADPANPKENDRQTESSSRVFLNKGNNVEDKDNFEDKVQYLGAKDKELLFKYALIINALALQAAWIDLVGLYCNLVFHLHLHVTRLTGITCLFFFWVSPLLGCAIFACRKKPFVTKRLKFHCILNLVAWLSGLASLFIWSHYI